MVYGPLAFGLLTGTLSPNTTFGSNDWRATGGRPGWNVGVFAEEYFQRNLQVVEDLKPIAESRGKGMPHLALRWGAVQSGGERRPGRDAHRAGG